MSLMKKNPNIYRLNAKEFFKKNFQQLKLIENIKGLFGSSILITQFSVSITQFSKMVGPISILKKKFVRIGFQPGGPWNLPGSKFWAWAKSFGL